MHFQLLFKGIDYTFENFSILITKFSEVGREGGRELLTDWVVDYPAPRHQSLHSPSDCSLGVEVIMRERREGWRGGGRERKGQGEKGEGLRRERSVGGDFHCPLSELSGWHFNTLTREHKICISFLQKKMKPFQTGFTFFIFSLDRPSRPIQSLNRNVHESCVCVSVCAIAENLLPVGLENSGQREYC